MSFLSVADWRAEDPRPPCLDLRLPADYATGHLPGAVNIPFDELRERLHELPPRGRPLFLYGPKAGEAESFLAQKPRWRLFHCDEPLPVEGLTREPGPPLWRPSPWLEEHCGRIPEGGRVLDLGVGSGRDAVFLALRGHRVEGVDRLPEAVERALDLARRWKVPLEARVRELTQGSLPANRYDALLAFHFQSRELYGDMRRALRPGGLFIGEAFMLGQEKRGSPRDPRRLLRPGELAEAFEGFEILARREGERPQGGVTSALVARKPALDRGSGGI